MKLSLILSVVLFTASSAQAVEISCEGDEGFRHVQRTNLPALDKIEVMRNAYYVWDMLTEEEGKTIKNSPLYFHANETILIDSDFYKYQKQMSESPQLVRFFSLFREFEGTSYVIKTSVSDADKKVSLPVFAVCVKNASLNEGVESYCMGAIDRLSKNNNYSKEMLEFSVVRNVVGKPLYLTMGKFHLNFTPNARLNLSCEASKQAL